MKIASGGHLLEVSEDGVEVDGVEVATMDDVTGGIVFQDEAPVDTDVLWVDTDDESGANNMVTSTDIRYIVQLTQAEYDALSPPDDNTLYVIVG